MGIYTEAIQKLYVAYFNRPADALGLAYWEPIVTAANGDTSAVSTAFSQSPEYTATFAGMTQLQIVATVYQNLFGHGPDKDGALFWANALMTNKLTVSNVVTGIAAGAIGADGKPNADGIIYANKVAAATAFTNALDTGAEVVGYQGTAANNAAKAWMNTIVDDASLKAAIAPAALDAAVATVVVAGTPKPTPITQSLTLGVDTVIGGAGDDVFTANVDVATGKQTITGLDSIDGGAGNDTLNVTDSVGGKVDFSLISVSNVENVKVTSIGDIAAAAGDVNVTGFSGLKTATFASAQTAGTNYVAGTGVSGTISNSTATGVTLKGFGGAVSVTTGAGAVTIGKAAGFAAADANGITSATIKGGTTVAVTDNSGTSGAIGAKLTTVSLDGNTGAATLTGDAISTVTVKGGVAASDVTIANTTAHALNLTVNNDATGLVITDSTATSANVTATGKKSAVALAVTKAATLTVAGDQQLTLDKVGSDYAKLTTVTSNSSGKLIADLTGADLLTTVTANAGAIDVTIKGTNAAATPAAQSVTGGAGNDKVTITGTLGKGSVLSLGDGSDTVAVAGGVITADAVVDAGAGSDTLALKIVGSANVGAFKNFENFDVAGASVAFDSSILATNNTVNNFVGTAATAAAVELTNLAAGVGFVVKGDMGTLAANVVTLTQATPGAITITSDADETTANELANTTSAKFSTNATSLNLVFDNANADSLDDVANTASLDVTASTATAVTIVSGGTEVVNSAKVTSNDKLASATVTGTQHLNLDFAATANKMATVDASGQTAGGLSFDLTDLTATGTVKLGGGEDIIALAAGGTFTAATNVQKVSGLGLGTAEDAAAQKGFDVLTFANAVQAADHKAADASDYNIKDGLYTFGGAGPATLGAAVTELEGHLGDNGAVVFQYAGNYYVFFNGLAAATNDDQLVQITGTSTIHGLDNIAAGTVYLF